MDSLILILVLVALILIGAPIGFVLVIIPTVYILITGAAPLTIVPGLMYDALASVPLVAIPFFMLTGELMVGGTITNRLVRLSQSLIGRLPGGLAQVNILVSTFFAGMNGSVVADTATVGSILIPAMKKAGYPAPFAAAVTAASSTIGGIIPPSVGMIVLASVAGLSVGALFAGGIIPGILITLSLMAITHIVAVRRGYERSDEPFSVGRLLAALRQASFALIIPGVLVGGIVGGVFSSVEAGAITALTAFLLGAFVYRTMRPRDVFTALVRAFRMSGSVFIIIAAAGPFAWLLSKIGALAMLGQWLGGYADSPVLFAIVLVLFIFVVGMIMESTANVLLLGPLLIEVAVQAGFAEIQAALVVIVGFLIGIATPPIGIAYFTASTIAGARLEHTAIAMAGFIAAEMAVLVALVIFPGLSMWLPTAWGLTG